jgi:hypothetical protein
MLKLMRNELMEILLNKHNSVSIKLRFVPKIAGKYTIEACAKNKM